MKIFVAGAKSQNVLDSAVKQRIQNIANKGYTVLVGDCYGIDTSVQCFLKSINYSNVFVYASNGKARNNVGNWQVKSIAVPMSVKGFDFYKQKDIAMAKDADYGFMIWDGKSKGTLNNMINLLLQDKPVLLYFVNEHKMVTLKTLEELEGFVSTLEEATNKLFHSLLSKAETTTKVSTILTEQIKMTI